MDLGTLGASTGSSIVSRIICYPLDTIAIQHSASTRRPIFSVPFRTYYRGMGVSIAIVTPAVGLYLCTYRQAKESLMPYLGETTWNYIASGTIAELASSFLWTPLEVIKARLQISKTAKEGKLLHNVHDIMKHEGIKGFYRGYFVGLAVFVPYNAIWWSTYENTKKATSFTSASAQAAAGSVAASIVSTLIIHPFDLLKTRFQVSTSQTISSLGAGSVNAHSRSDDSRGMRYVFRNLWREAGWRGLYMGLVPRLMCGIPSSMISMAVFEYFKPDANTKRSTSEFESNTGREPLMEG